MKLGGILDLFFPPACAACGEVLEQPAPLCPACELHLSPIPEPQCRFCAEPGEHPAAVCDRCRQRRPAFERAWAPFVHEGALARAIHRFKYEDHPELAEPLGELLGRSCTRFLDPTELVMAIPLHESRFRERKFDQAQLLARALARKTGAAFEGNGLARVRATQRQVGLSEAQREANLEGAFEAERIDRPVLLVDDVFTTGATARAAARALQLTGCPRVRVLTLARAWSEAGDPA